ncbi:MAG: S1/P1 nuclease [Flavobacteriaceae bacterium]|nr:S1/P1 nuclease [Flavobacteriaceae bacterium]
MKYRILLILIIAFLTTNYANTKPTWGKTGHRTIGKIAEKHLKKSVKRKIDKLLNGESLAFVSTYADEIKSDKNFNKFYTWHYVNFPFDTDYKDSKKNKKGDLITGIETCLKILKNNSTLHREDKVFYLKMLVHLIGDLHQPLHIGRSEDKGGNAIQVQWFNKGSNLHRVWDTDMIKKWNMSYIELANNTKFLSKKEIKNYQKGSVLDWVYESQSLAKKVYESAETGHKLSYRYSYDHFKTVRMQLQKGGLRLAKLLNEIFD